MATMAQVGRRIFKRRLARSYDPHLQATASKVLGNQTRLSLSHNTPRSCLLCGGTSFRLLTVYYVPGNEKTQREKQRRQK